MEGIEKVLLHDFRGTLSVNTCFPRENAVQEGFDVHFVQKMGIALAISVC